MTIKCGSNNDQNQIQILIPWGVKRKTLIQLRMAGNMRSNNGSSFESALWAQVWLLSNTFSNSQFSTLLPPWFPAWPCLQIPKDTTSVNRFRCIYDQISEFLRSLWQKFLVASLPPDQKGKAVCSRLKVEKYDWDLTAETSIWNYDKMHISSKLSQMHWITSDVATKWVF